MARKSLSHLIGVVYHCPMDQGSEELIALSYRGRPDVDLWVHLDGCGGVSNGYIVAGQAWWQPMTSGSVPPGASY
jgi:hypothetical protein